MSVEQLITEASALSAAERRTLIGILVRQGRELSAEYRDRMAAKIEDRDPAHWVTEEDLDRVLGLDGSNR